eukprot:scaffold4362_cov106-Isochrysis_galbana.AAC.6
MLGRHRHPVSEGCACVFLVLFSAALLRAPTSSNILVTRPARHQRSQYIPNLLGDFRLPRDFVTQNLRFATPSRTCRGGGGSAGRGGR